MEATGAEIDELSSEASETASTSSNTHLGSTPLGSLPPTGLIRSIAMAAQDTLVGWYVSSSDWVIDKEDIDPGHAHAIGRLLVRLQTIETLLRLRLYELEERRGAHPSAGLGALHLLKRGDSVHVAEGDHFASYDPLQSLLDKFSTAFSVSELESGRTVLLRDALAHGRLLPIRRDGAVILKLLKFGRVERGTMDGKPHDTARVEFAAELTPAWFQDNETFLDGELAKVRSAGA